MADKDDLADAKELFALCAEREADNRAEAEEDVRFARLEEQWPEDVRKRRLIEGRPMHTLNKLPAFIHQVVNDARQNKPEIKVHPADDGADQQVAEIYNGLIRNIEAQSDADVAYDTALEHAVDRGFGYFRVVIDYAHDDGFDLDLLIKPVHNPFSVYGDPHSTSADSGDWNDAFVTDLMPRDAFKAKYKGADDVDWDALGYTRLDTPWGDEDEILTAEWWHRDEVVTEIVKLSNGELVSADVMMANQALFAAMDVDVVGTRKTLSYRVTQKIMTGAEVLETNRWAGKYIPIIPVYGETINLNGKRHLRSLIRSAKDAQRAFNYERSLATELSGLQTKAPWIGKKGTFKSDADNWATANVENHAYLEYDGEKPERQPFAGPPAGALQAAINAEADMKSIIGMQASSLGEDGNEKSGRAILAKMREGDVATFHFNDNLQRSIRQAGRVLIDLIPHVYSQPRMVRVMGQDGSPSMVPINQPVVAKPPGPDAMPGAPPQFVPAAAAPQAPDGDDTAQAAMPLVFDLTQGKYDLVVTAGPSFTTRREEAANQMIELSRADPAILPLIGDLLVKNLDWPGADEIAKRIVAAKQQAPQGGPSAEAQAKLAAIQQEGQLKQQQAQQAHELALQQSAQKMEIERQEMELKLQLEREKMKGQMDLAREKAAFDAQLAEEGLRAATAVKVASAAAHVDQTTELPEVTPGGDIG